MDDERVDRAVYIRFADDYDQGNLHHVGGSLYAVASANRWAEMGKAGVQFYSPTADEPARDARFERSIFGGEDTGAPRSRRVSSRRTASRPLIHTGPRHTTKA